MALTVVQPSGINTSATFTFANVNVSSNLSVTGNAYFGNLNGGNLTSANYVSGTLTTAAQPNITSLGTLSSLVVSGNITAANLVGSHSNGNSNVNIPAANGNVNISAVGNANILIITGTGANIAGTLSVSGKSNLGPAGNVIITGGTSGYVLQTDGAGNLSWAATSSGGASNARVFGTSLVFGL